MTFTVLVVCRANVCRSPLTALMLREWLPQLKQRYGLRVVDCGDKAEPGQPPCRSMVRWASLNGLPAEELALHRSTPLDRRLVGSADLVLTADRRTRSAVVRLCPDAVDRSFTLREAATLAVDLPGREPGLTCFVKELNGNRGLTGLSQDSVLRPALRPWRRIRIHDHDVLDAHQDADVNHAVVRGQLNPAVEQLVDALIRVPHPA